MIAEPAHRPLHLLRAVGLAAALALTVGPARPDQTGLRLLAEGRVEEAAEHFARLLDRDPDAAAAIEGRVRALLALDRWPAALAEARAHAARVPADPRVSSALGEALYRAGRFEEAERLLEPLLERDVSGESVPPRAEFTLSRLRGAAGRIAEARTLIERALARAPADRDLHWWAAEIAGSREASLRHLESYLDLSGGDDPDRIEAARGSIELFRQLGEREIWQLSDPPERLELPLRPIWNDRGQRLGYVVSARIGEKRKPVRLLLDTGSPGLFLVERVARKHGFTPLAETTTFGGGGDRRHRSDRGLFATLELGGLRFREALATTTSRELEPQGRFHGVLGIAIFNGYHVTLDLPGKRLLLEPPRSDGAGSRYWTCAAQILVPLTSVGPEPAMFLFDTGASFSVVSTALVARLPGARLGAAADVQTFGGTVEGARMVERMELEFEGLQTREALRAVDLSLRSRLTGVEIAGYLGLDLLDRAVIEFDTVGRRVSVRRDGRGQRGSTPSSRSTARGEE